MRSIEPTDDLKNSLVGQVLTVNGTIAIPGKLPFPPSLPKARPGKVTRLRDRAALD